MHQTTAHKKRSVVQEVAQPIMGCATVVINNKPAVCLGDDTWHCGGAVNMIEGSGDSLAG